MKAIGWFVAFGLGVLAWVCFLRGIRANGDAGYLFFSLAFALLTITMLGLLAREERRGH